MLLKTQGTSARSSTSRDWSAVVTPVKCAREQVCFSCHLSRRPPASCLWSWLSYSRYMEVENKSVGVSLDLWLPPRPRRRGLLHREAPMGSIRVPSDQPPWAVAEGDPDTAPRGQHTDKLAGHFSPCPTMVHGMQNKKCAEGWGSSPWGKETLLSPASPSSKCPVLTGGTQDSPTTGVPSSLVKYIYSHQRYMLLSQ